MVLLLITVLFRVGSCHLIVGLCSVAITFSGRYALKE